MSTGRACFYGFLAVDLQGSSCESRESCRVVGRWLPVERITANAETIPYELYVALQNGWVAAILPLEYFAPSITGKHHGLPMVVILRYNVLTIRASVAEKYDHNDLFDDDALLGRPKKD